MVKRRTISLAIVMTLTSIAVATSQTSSHERLGVERKDIAEITVGAGLGIATAANSGFQGLELDPMATLDILVLRSFSLSLSLPAASWVATENAPEPGYAAALGDPSIALGYSLRMADWRLGAAASYQYPLGVWNYYEAAERHIASGSGYQTLGLDLSANRYLDPLVAGIRLSASTALKKQGQFTTSSRPLLLNLGFSATEAFNEVVALSVSLANELDSPRLIDGRPENGGWQYSLSGSASLSFSSEKLAFRIGLSKTLSNYTSLPRVDAAASYTIRIKE